MGSYLRSAVAATVGTVVSIVLAYIGAVVMLLVRSGIPLGSPGWEPTRGEYAGLLWMTGGAAAVGGRIAGGIARQQRRPVAAAQAALLAGGTLWGFSSPASHWPTWWAPAMAAVLAVGTWLGAATRRQKR